MKLALSRISLSLILSLSPSFAMDHGETPDPNDLGPDPIVRRIEFHTGCDNLTFLSGAAPNATREAANPDIVKTMEI